MGHKIIIVGGVAGGASAAARLRRLGEDHTIIMFEKGPHVSFSNCSLPYHLSGMVEPAEKLVLMSPEKFLKQYAIQARVNQEVIAIDRAAKKVTVKQLDTGETYEESYDYLILSPGAKPIMPMLPGIEKVNTFQVRNVVDITKLNTFIKANDAKDIVVVGGGYIGVEVAENLREAGYSVTLVEAGAQILRPFDEDMAQILHKEMYEQGVNLILGDKVSHFEEKRVVLGSGRTVTADAVVMAIGVTPDIALAKEAGIAISDLGAIAVDETHKTNDPYIFAVGDAVEVDYALTGKKMKLSLAGPAQKQARLVADYIHGKKTINKGYIGSSAIKVFDYNGAATGLNESMIKMLEEPINYEKVMLIQNDKVSLMPDSHPMFFKLLFEVPTGRVLGAQAIGKGNVDKRIDVIATVIKFGGTVEDLRDLELTYAPPFGTAKDVVNYAGYIGSNLLQGDFKQITVDQVRGLVEEGATFVDVREQVEYERGHIKNAIHIPLSELRERINELPKDKTLYVHCRSGQRSYNAVRLLQNLGFDHVINVTGSFLGLCMHEYFKDQVEKREPIVTNYCFK